MLSRLRKLSIVNVILFLKILSVKGVLHLDDPSQNRT